MSKSASVGVRSCGRQASSKKEGQKSSTRTVAVHRLHLTHAKMAESLSLLSIAACRSLSNLAFSSCSRATASASTPADTNWGALVCSMHQIHVGGADAFFLVLGLSKRSPSPRSAVDWRRGGLRKKKTRGNVGGSFDRAWWSGLGLYPLVTKVCRCLNLAFFGRSREQEKEIKRYSSNHCCTTQPEYNATGQLLARCRQFSHRRKRQFPSGAACKTTITRV